MMDSGLLKRERLLLKATFLLYTIPPPFHHWFSPVELCSIAERTNPGSEPNHPVTTESEDSPFPIYFEPTSPRIDHADLPTPRVWVPSSSPLF